MPGIAIGNCIPFNRGGVNWSSYWKTLKAAMTTPPSAAYEVAADTFIRALDTGGVWAKLDFLYVFAAETNGGGEALLNWVNPGTYNGLLVNAPAFTVNAGFKGDGSSSYINTQFNPSTAGGKFSLNSASMGAYVNIVNTNETNTLMGSSAGNLFLSPNNNLSQFRGSLNSTVDFSNKGVRSSTPQMVSVVRPNATTITTYKGATSMGDAAVNATSIPNAIIRILMCPGSSYSNAEVSMAFAGAALTQADMTVLNNAWNAFFLT